MPAEIVDQPLPRSFSRQIGGTVHDLREAPRRFLLNDIAGSVLVPRALRHLLYRWMGLRLRTPQIMHGCTFEGPPANVSVGTATFINTRCHFESAGPISIGRDCGLAMGVCVVTSTHEIDAHGVWGHHITPRPVRIGDRVWVGARALILPGVTIGDHSVIAAGAVVARDCEPWGLYAGTPARRIRDLR